MAKSGVRDERSEEPCERGGKCLNCDFRVIDRMNMIIANHKNQVHHLKIMVLTKGGKQKVVGNDKKCIFAP